MKNKPIGVFDSGLGGLTCVNELMQIMPNESIVYFGDTGRVPYGSRSEETIIKYVRSDINFLISQDVKLVVAACGTASTVALPHLTGEYAVPVIGVVEAAAEAAVKATANGKIGVIGTVGTIRNGKYEKLIKEKNAKLETFSKACPLFVPLVENGLNSHEITRMAAEMYLEEIKSSGADTLILGCTHYPMLKKPISEYLPNVTLIDPGAETAHRVKSFLTENGLISEKSAESRYYVSDTADGFEHLAGIFMNRSIEGKAEKIDIERY